MNTRQGVQISVALISAIDLCIASYFFVFYIILNHTSDSGLFDYHFLFRVYLTGFHLYAIYSLQKLRLENDPKRAWDGVQIWVLSNVQLVILFFHGGSGNELVDRVGVPLANLSRMIFFLLLLYWLPNCSKPAVNESLTRKCLRFVTLLDLASITALDLISRIWPGEKYIPLLTCLVIWGLFELSSYLSFHTGTTSQCQMWLAALGYTVLSNALIVKQLHTVFPNEWILFGCITSMRLALNIAVILGLRHVTGYQTSKDIGPPIQDP